MATTPQERTTLRRSLSVWQAVGISVALMAPSMAANINPQGTAGQVGRSTPLAFFLSALAVLLIAYVFVRLCQYYRHAGSVYVFAGATLGPRAGAVAGLGLIGTYTFYALVTASAAGIFGASFLDIIGVWNDQPWWAGFLVGGIALLIALYFSIVPARSSTSILLSCEGVTVLLILAVAAIVQGKLLAGKAPNGASFDLDVFKVPAGTPSSDLFLGIVFGILSFAGFEAAAIVGGLYFTCVTAVDMMGFGTDAKGVDAFISSPALMGDLGSSYVGDWVGDVITLGAAVSAFACCLACIVAASRMVYAVSRDLAPGSLFART